MNLEQLFDTIDKLKPDEKGCVYLPRKRTKNPPTVQTSYKLIHGRRIYCGTGSRSIARLLVERANNKELDEFTLVRNTCGDNNCVNCNHLIAVDRREIFKKKHSSI
jgi:hypothetical protein